MYFVLSKTLGIVAIPSNLILLIVAAGLLLRRSRNARLGKQLTVAGVVLFLIGGATRFGTTPLLAAPKLGEHWLLVTSALHMPRAMGLFRKAGFAVEAYPVDYTTGGWRGLRALPSSLIGGVYKLDLAGHEWQALLVDWATGRSPALLPGPAP